MSSAPRASVARPRVLRDRPLRPLRPGRRRPPQVGDAAQPAAEHTADGVAAVRRAGLSAGPARRVVQLPRVAAGAVGPDGNPVGHDEGVGLGGLDL